MKWVNHLLVAGATTAVFSPALVPAALLGSTAPDWLESVAKLLGRKLPHRGPTHWVAAWVLGLGFFLFSWDVRGIGAAFAWGGLSHVLLDALTVAGVPFSPLSDRRFHIAGGRFRTGGAGEYIFSAVVVLLCWVVSGQFAGAGDAGYIPFFPDWAEWHEQGLVTPAEWKANRFRFF